MSEPSQGFAGLLARARQGDEAATVELVRAYEPELRLVARLRLGPALRPYLDSVDLVQSVHKSLLIGLRAERFDISSPEKLIALALTMVRRKVARHWRHLRRQKRLDDSTTGSPDLAGLLTSLSTPPPDAASAAQLHEAIQVVCQSLDDTERRLIELRLEGYSTVEAARELGVNADVLRVRLSRLRQRLRSSGALTEWL